MDVNPSQTNRSNIIQVDSHDTARKYEERIKMLMDCISKLDYDEGQSSNVFQEQLMDFERMIDEECVNRMNKINELNIKLILKLTQTKYDYSQSEKSYQDYDSFRKSIADQLLNINFN